MMVARGAIAHGGLSSNKDRESGEAGLSILNDILDVERPFCSTILLLGSNTALSLLSCESVVLRCPPLIEPPPIRRWYFCPFILL